MLAGKSPASRSASGIAITIHALVADDDRAAARGSFNDEAEVLAQVHDEFFPGQGLRMVGQHHEIYLSDFRSVAPDEQGTILRQPVTTSSNPMPPTGGWVHRPVRPRPGAALRDHFPRDRTITLTRVPDTWAAGGDHRSAGATPPR